MPENDISPRTTVSATGPELRGPSWRGISEEKLQMASEVNAIAPAVDRVVGAIRRAGCVPGNESDIEIALFEALANAVVHGNHEDRSKKVHICCRYKRGDNVTITIKDEGTGFDPGKVPDPTATENIEAEHGRGILMMKTFMDEVRYEKGGTEVHMRKKCYGLPSATGISAFLDRVISVAKSLFKI
jgi:serine/threonine-protein kinase RsbW